ncbi:T9SS type A sorting domain-containing protein [bacterium]|nr:T9SS type A sorting domain-containing protein [bacterium]
MMKIIPPVVGYNYLYEVFMGMLLDAGNPDVTWAIYRYYKPSQSLERLNSYGKMYIEFTLSDDTSWIEWKRSVKTDWVINRGLSTNLVLDSIYLVSYGSLQGGWFGQKVYIDNIRLTGYADYDVGIKGILSGDSVWKNTGYTPTARIKNFGRKPADSFLVIAEIKNGVNIVYSDTMPYFLPADTEDTVSFKEFTPPDASNYTLTVSTLMTPDESDEDDEMSKTLYGSGIEEQPIPSGLAFEVSSFTPSPRVSYSIPAGQQGTISLYDPSGRRIESYRVQGEGQVAIKAGLSSGVYFVKLETGKANLTRKAVVLH